MKSLIIALVSILVMLGPVSCASQNLGKAPDFSLDSATGSQVSLSQLLEENEAVVLVFYRGFF